MNDTLICDELCELDLDVRSTDEFFEVMSKKAKDLDYVTEQFLSAIKKREQDYPTALPVKPYPVAIPHSDPINIVKQFIAPVRLKNAISWCEMANNDSSQTVAFRINRMLEKENITNVRVEAVNLRSLQRELHGALAYIDITNSHMDYGIPTVNGLAFLSGEHKEEAFQELIKIIKNR